MGDQVLVKIWHAGKLIWKPKVKYMGGETTAVQIESDKMSYFKLADYVIESSSYTTKNFLMYYLTPGMKLDKGLVLLKDDKDVEEMMKLIGDDFKHMVHLYIQGPLKEPELTNAKKAQSLSSPVAHSSPSSHGNPTHPKSNSFSTTTLNPHLQTLNDIDEGADDEIEDELEDGFTVFDNEEEAIAACSDSSDEEYQECVNNTQKFNQDQKLASEEIINKVIHDDLPVDEGDQLEGSDAPESSYDESDAYVYSPGESEDDDIKGKKYKTITPIVTDLTDWSKWEWVVGTRFESRDSFKSALKNYAVTNGRNVVITSSNRKRKGKIVVGCVAGCPFRLWVSFHDKKKCYMLKSAFDKHTCQRNMNKNRQLDQGFIANTFLPVFKSKPHWSAKEIQDAVKEKFKVLITPWMAYNAKRVAHKKLHGSMKEHYCKLGSYLEALRQANPSSTFELMTVPSTYVGSDTGSEVFYRLFICFDGVKRGFLSGCRKIICLDGCFLKTFLGGMLLAAIGRDPNDQMYPIAWAVVEGENTDSWTWFMEQLKKSLEVTNNGKGWTLISDQQKGLLNAVVNLWGDAEHRNCARHIYANWNKKHKGDELKGIFWSACRAYCLPDYKKALVEMRQASESAANDFLKQDPKNFCRAYFDTNTRSDVIVNNMAETFNGYIIKSRSKHIINMLEDIRVTIMTRLTRLKTNMTSKEVKICPRIQTKLNRRKDIAWRCEVFPSSNTLFQVKELDDVIVDMEKHTCSCRKWDLTGVPCHHACAVIAFLGQETEDFVEKHHTKEVYLQAYSYTIPPLPSEKFWPEVDLPLDPPPIKIQPGRPKKNRKKDPHENPKKPGKLTKHGCSSVCGICKCSGHNRRKCPQKDKHASASQGNAASQASASASASQVKSQKQTQTSQQQQHQGKRKKSTAASSQGKNKFKKPRTANN